MDKIQNDNQLAVRNIYSQLPQLPSARFKYSVWHDLKSTTVKGDELKAPRIRIGPNVNYIENSNEMRSEYKDVESFHDLTGKQQKKHRDDMENWEKAELASFGYQELQEGYQKKNLYRILDRIQHVKYLNLAHNEIIKLNSLSFPQCEYLNLNNNNLTSLKGLPRLKIIKYLTIKDNDIKDLDGITTLKSTAIEELYLNSNPVVFTQSYRQRVFSVLPDLKVLDGVYRLTSDLAPVEEESQQKTCILM